MGRVWHGQAGLPTSTHPGGPVLHPDGPDSLLPGWAGYPVTRMDRDHVTRLARDRSTSAGPESSPKPDRGPQTRLGRIPANSVGPGCPTPGSLYSLAGSSKSLPAPSHARIAPCVWIVPSPSQQLIPAYRGSGRYLTCSAGSIQGSMSQLG